MTKETIKDAAPATEHGVGAAAPTSSKAPARRPVVRWMLPSLESIVFCFVLLGVILLGQSHIPGGNGDTALHLRLGNDILLRGSLVPTNTLTQAGYGQPLLAWEWLSDVIFAGIWHFFGLNGLLAVVGLVVALTALFLLRAVRKRGAPLLLTLPLTIAGITLTSIDWSATPTIFSLPLTLWWSEQLWAYWQTNNARKLWPLPFVLAIWANLDSGSIVGLIMLMVATMLVWLFPNAASTRNVEARQWQLTRASGACLVALLLTPWGITGFTHISAYFANRILPGQPGGALAPDVHQYSGQIFLLLILLLGACGILRGWLVGGRAAQPADPRSTEQQRTLARMATREPGALGWALAGVFTALAFFSPNLLALWGVIVAPIMGRELTSWTAEWASADLPGRLTRFCQALFRLSWRAEAREQRLRSVLWSGVALVFVLVLLINQGTFPGSTTPVLNAQFSSDALPVEALQTIMHGAIPGHTLPQGAGFTVIDWADYLEWALPQHRIMIDSRIDFFDANTLNDYQTLLNGLPGWDQIINAYGIRWLLVPSTVPLAQVITLARGWLCQEADTHHIALLCVPAPTLPIT